MYFTSGVLRCSLVTDELLCRLCDAADKHISPSIHSCFSSAGREELHQVVMYSQSSHCTFVNTATGVQSRNLNVTLLLLSIVSFTAGRLSPLTVRCKSLKVKFTAWHSIHHVWGCSSELICIDLTCKYDTTSHSTVSTLSCDLQKWIVHSKVADTLWYSYSDAIMTPGALVSSAVAFCPE